MIDNNKILIVLTDNYPYGTSETFLESETPYWGLFNKIYLCPIGVYNNLSNRTRYLENPKIELIKLNSKRIVGLQKVKLICKVFSSRAFYREWLELIKKVGFDLSAIKTLISFTAYTIEETGKFLDICKSISNTDNITIYAYWLYRQAMVAIMLKRAFKNVVAIISRAHGFDVYEERHSGYIPYRNYLLANIDKIYCISLNGQFYLQNKYPEYKRKILLSYLGTKDYGETNFLFNREIFKIVSCSSCVPVKRVHKIIESLRLLNNGNVRIEWTHYGAGKLYDSVVKLAKENLGDYVSYIFSGQLSNEDILSEYKKKPYDLFINVSESEGIPVSIMEAMSFGTPVVATDVGGTSELVVPNKSGFLLKVDFSPEELTQKIIEIVKMQREDYISMRKEARKQWESNFSAKNNYPTFINNIFMER